MKVVANASILIGLSSIGRLDLLYQRFPTGILIPPAVWTEVVEQGQGRPGARQVAEAAWISVQSLSRSDMVQLLRLALEQGEAEAIALANELRADVVLLDELDARRVAKQLGLSVLGTVGVLIWAKRTGKLSNLRQALDDLQNTGKFRLSQMLYQKALQEVGE